MRGAHHRRCAREGLTKSLCTIGGKVARNRGQSSKEHQSVKAEPGAVAHKTLDNLDELFPQILSRKQTQERTGRIFKALDNILRILQFTSCQPLP